MPDVFDYDVFLSFASEDEELARPIWQELSVSGLRVFWSDASLKSSLGASWSDVIESALQRSRHFLLLVTPAALSSVWVKREYTAFHNHCFRPNVRRLVPVLTSSFRLSDLPLFLRDLQACQLSDASAMKQVIQTLGGTDVEVMKRQLAALESENAALRDRLIQLDATPVQPLAQPEDAKPGKAVEGERSTGTKLPVVSEPRWGVPTEGEVLSVIAALQRDHLEAIETLYGVKPKDPGFREVIRHAMTIGLIRRAEIGGAWGKSNAVQKIKWSDADEDAKRLRRIVVTDLDGGVVDVLDPVINRHMASDRIALDIAQGKGTIKLEWWRVRLVTILGGVLGKVPGWYSFDVLDSEVLLTDGTTHRVGVVDGYIAGKVPLGSYGIQIAKLRKLAPITSLHEARRAMHK